MTPCKHRFRTCLAVKEVGFYADAHKRPTGSYHLRTLRCDDCGAVFDERVETRC